MGRIRTLTVKRAAKQIVGLYSDRFKTDFEHNKLKLPEVAGITSKKLRNKIAGYITSLIKQKAMGRTPYRPTKERKPPRKGRPIQRGRKRK